MIAFSKSIKIRDHKLLKEDQDPALREYMEYQRKLFPYTIVRAGLDLAYKELDDILNYVENDNQPPPESNRQDYPADPTEWFRARFPWSAAFMSMENMHELLVIAIQCMDSFRTDEKASDPHWAVMYDAVHNIVKTYNELLEEAPENARDINLSRGVAVDFDDFVNNYWPRLDFMLLSGPDYPHAPLLERNRQIEHAVQEKISAGMNPLQALESVAGEFELDESVICLLGRRPLESRHKEAQKLALESGENRDAASDSEAEALDAGYQKCFEAFRGLPKAAHSVKLS